MTGEEVTEDTALSADPGLSDSSKMFPQPEHQSTTCSQNTKPARSGFQTETISKMCPSDDLSIEHSYPFCFDSQKTACPLERVTDNYEPQTLDKTDTLDRDRANLGDGNSKKTQVASPEEAWEDDQGEVLHSEHNLDIQGQSESTMTIGALSQGSVDCTVLSEPTDSIQSLAKENTDQNIWSSDTQASDQA